MLADPRALFIVAAPAGVMGGNPQAGHFVSAKGGLYLVCHPFAQRAGGITIQRCGHREGNTINRRYAHRGLYAAAFLRAADCRNCRALDGAIIADIAAAIAFWGLLRRLFRHRFLWAKQAAQQAFLGGLACDCTDIWPGLWPDRAEHPGARLCHGKLWLRICRLARNRCCGRRVYGARHGP